MFYYFLFPKQKYYHLLKCTAIMCIISVIIYITYPTYDDKFYLHDPSSHDATLFGETPSFHTMNSMILCLACIPMKKSKGQIILFIIALVLFIMVVPTAIYTNRHYSIDVITSIVLVSLV
jgi:membrane-associated phospholipid phosphatase